MRRGMKRITYPSITVLLLLVMRMHFCDTEEKVCTGQSDASDENPCALYTFGPSCSLQCRCKPKSPELGCRQDGSCDPTSRCQTGYTGTRCTKQDMANYKTTWQSSTRNNTYYAHYAVDNNDDSTCSSTDPEDWEPEWRVDLGRLREIYHFELDNGFERMRHLTVYVSNDTTPTPEDVCFATGSRQTGKWLNREWCNKPMIGRYMIIRRTGAYPTAKPGVIALCNLKITECEPLTFGQSCQNYCNCYDPNELCRTDGKCTSGCKCGYRGYTCLDECPDGTYGYNCSMTCQCKDGDVCRRSDGHCPNGCRASKTGVDCQADCQAGSFGGYCRGVCHCSGGAAHCNSETGVCSDGCAPGWQGYACQQACANGTFGRYCSGVCHCVNGTGPCVPETGYCPGGCSEGRRGSSCQQVCLPGTFGRDCSKMCACGQAKRCDPFTGACLQRPPEPELELSPVQIAGIAIGCLAGLIIVIVALWCFCRRRLRLLEDEAIKKEHATAVGRMWPPRLSQLSQKDRDMLLKRNPAYEKHKDSLAGLSKISFNTDKRDSGIFETVDEDPGYMTVSEIERSLARSISTSTNKTANSSKHLHKPGARSISVSTSQYDQQYPVFSSIYLKNSDYTDCDGAGGHMSMSTIDSDASSRCSHGGNSYMSVHGDDKDSDDNDGYARETDYAPDSSCYSPYSISSGYNDSGGSCDLPPHALEATASGLSSNPSPVTGKAVHRESYIHPSSAFSDTEGNEPEYDMSDNCATDKHDYTGIEALKRQLSSPHWLPNNDGAVVNQENMMNLKRYREQIQVDNNNKLIESIPSDGDFRTFKTQDSYFVTYGDLARSSSHIEDDSDSTKEPAYDMSEDQEHIRIENNKINLSPPLLMRSSQSNVDDQGISMNMVEDLKQEILTCKSDILDSVPHDPVRGTLQTQDSYFLTYEEPPTQNDSTNENTPTAHMLPSEYDNAVAPVDSHLVPIADFNRCDVVAGLPIPEVDNNLPVQSQAAHIHINSEHTGKELIEKNANNDCEDTYM